MNYNIRSVFLDGKTKETHIDEVTCPVEEVATQLQIIGKTLMDPNNEFSLGDFCNISVKLVPNESY